MAPAERGDKPKCESGCPTLAASLFLRLGWEPSLVWVRGFVAGFAICIPLFTNRIWGCHFWRPQSVQCCSFSRPRFFSATKFQIVAIEARTLLAFWRAWVSLLRLRWRCIGPWASAITSTGRSGCRQAPFAGTGRCSLSFAIRRCYGLCPALLPASRSCAWRRVKNSRGFCSGR